MVTKNHILAEIARTAEQNGGVPLGRDRFCAETGIKETDWLGKYWARWSDAVREAGLQPNTLQKAYGEEFLLEKLVSLAKELGRFPGRTEIQLKGHSDKSFPDAKTFQRLGSKAELAAKLARFCADREGYEEVACACRFAGTLGRMPISPRGFPRTVRIRLSAEVWSLLQGWPQQCRR